MIHRKVRVQVEGTCRQGRQYINRRSPTQILKAFPCHFPFAGGNMVATTALGWHGLVLSFIIAMLVMMGAGRGHTTIAALWGQGAKPNKQTKRLSGGDRTPSRARGASRPQPALQPWRKGVRLREALQCKGRQRPPRLVPRRSGALASRNRQRP